MKTQLKKLTTKELELVRQAPRSDASTNDAVRRIAQRTIEAYKLNMTVDEYLFACAMKKLES